MQTSDDLLATILHQTEELKALRTHSPEMLQMIENTTQLKAWHQEYCLWKAEHRTTTAFPRPLNEIRSTVPLVPPPRVTKLVPPPIT
eukprot:1555136-Ditylum_brightwellii.AAC.1